MPDDRLPEIYVLPGESHVVQEPTLLRTVLGSCVGVAFLIPRLGVGALCHPMLPKLPEDASKIPALSARRRYVDFAIRELAERFEKLNMPRQEICVKLFGGGDVLPAISQSSRPTVGRLNREMALSVLNDCGLEIAASSLGGTQGVQIRFNTGTGEVLLKRLS